MLNSTSIYAGHASNRCIIWLSNLEELGQAFDSSFYEHALNDTVERLQRLGLSVHRMAGKKLALIANVPLTLAKDFDAGNIYTAIDSKPVLFGLNHVYLQVEVQALGSLELAEVYGRSRSVSCRQQLASNDVSLKWRRDYQKDMHLASRLLGDLALGKLAVAFQPVATRKHSAASPSLYYECLLRRCVPETADGYVVPDAIQALERLGLVDRLDRSMLWTTLDTLIANEALNLGCNVSARSFVKTAWWKELLEYLEERPDLAQRLVVEITETSTFPHDKNAQNLIRHLQLLGVRIALDDLGKQPGSLDLLHKVRANIIKLDKSVLKESADGTLPLRRLQGLMDVCADHCANVIVEGIDSTEKLNAALSAGATGFQGYLIARPSLYLRELLNGVVYVRDATSKKTTLSIN